MVPKFLSRILNEHRTFVYSLVCPEPVPVRERYPAPVNTCFIDTHEEKYQTYLRRLIRG
jgi:hypothetical protein